MLDQNKKPGRLNFIIEINPYPANVDNMANSYQSSKWRMGFNSAFKGLMLVGGVVF